ncbi:MAG: hypothetical protein J6Z25_03830 [Opitutales bacterium]|nr:hypothetical protein [Opitutales bacterium]
MLKENMKDAQTIEKEKSFHVVMENCFGIKKLDYKFNFQKSHVIVIYAHNGVGKSSFCRAFECYRIKEVIRDEVTAVKGSLTIKGSVGEEVKESSITVCRMDDENLEEAFTALDFIKTKYDGKTGQEKNMIEVRKKKFAKMVQEMMKHFNFPFAIDKEQVGCFVKRNKIYTHEEIFPHLSKGEQTAFCFFKAYYQMLALKSKESKKGEESEKKRLILIDDIADMFDSRNRLAMLVYLQEKIEANPNCYWIIFPHNYDFYSTLCSRLGLHGNNRLVARKQKESGEVGFCPIPENPFRYWCQKAGQEAKGGEREYIGDQCFLCLIPLVRQWIATTQNTNEGKHKELLTHLLHYFKVGGKRGTEEITCDEVIEVLQRYVTCNNEKINLKETVWELLNRTCDQIVSNRLLTLEDEMVLAMAIRLKAEKFMINEGCKPTNLNRTRNLFEGYKQKKPQSKKTQTLRAVVTILPDFIHCNAFFYEPLIDLDGSELLELYQKVKDLRSKKTRK